MSATKTCYSYDAHTGEYNGETFADLSPLDEDEVWLYPANTTPVAPPAAEPQKARVWDGERWGLVPDHRGETWWEGPMPVRVQSLGDPAAFEPPLSADAPEKPKPLPPPISARQFFQQLAHDGVITEQEAEETAEGKLPALLIGAINQLPEEARFPARMMARRATEFARNEQLVSVIAAILKWDDARLDALWENASKL